MKGRQRFKYEALRATLARDVVDADERVRVW